jgi:hypothetical protein
MKRTEIHSRDISAVRLAQYHMTPPVVQVIVDLVKPHGYTWEAAGNRLIVRLQELRVQQQGEECGAVRARPHRIHIVRLRSGVAVVCEEAKSS